MPRRIHKTPENVLAGRYIERVRGKMPQGVFARKLASHLDIALTQSALSKYESGDRPVPAAILIAASKLTGEPLFLDEEGANALAAQLADRAWRELQGRAKALGWPSEPPP